ncbi:MAG TPA: ATP-binding protein [Actinomycetes bacterium]|nr:ATP-binding protein [Actinomycetes bacterium]
MEVHRHSFPGTPASVPAARRFVRGVLRHPCGDDCPQAEMVELACSEFVTNALHHTPSGNGGTITVAIAHQPGMIRLEVDDAGTAVPPLRPVVPDELAESSRGLMIVNSIATRWGDDGVHGPSMHAGGLAGWHRAWAEFECPETSIQR